MIHLVIGRRERGKTTLAYYMAQKSPQRLIFDPRGLITRGSVARVYTSGQLRARMPALADGRISELVYQPTEDDLDEAFQSFARQMKRWVRDVPDRELAVVVDELSFADTASPAFYWCLKCCRRDRFHVFMTCHRPADVPTSIRALADEWWLFQCVQEHDLEVLRVRCAPATASEVARLRGRQVVRWNENAEPERRMTRYPDEHGTDWYVPMTDAAQPTAITDLHAAPGGVRPPSTSLFD